MIHIRNTNVKPNNKCLKNKLQLGQFSVFKIYLEVIYYFLPTNVLRVLLNGFLSQNKRISKPRESKNQTEYFIPLQRIFTVFFFSI